VCEHQGRKESEEREGAGKVREIKGKREGLQRGSGRGLAQLSYTHMYDCNDKDYFNTSRQRREVRV